MENINLNDIISEIDRSIINLQRLKTNLMNQIQINETHNSIHEPSRYRFNYNNENSLFQDLDIVNSLLNLTSETISPRVIRRPPIVRRPPRTFTPLYSPEFRRTYTASFRNFNDFQGNLLNLTRRIFDDYDDFNNQNQNYDNLEDHIVCLSPQEYDNCVETKILSESEKEKCPICLDEKTNTNMTKIKKCNHIFCDNCIKFWLTQRSKKCPVCRILVNEN